LLFTAPPVKRGEVEALAKDLDLPLTRIGSVTPGEPEVTVRDARGDSIPVARKGFDHFG
jgi:thiamine-monophosphate kinase